MENIIEFLRWFLNTPKATVGFACIVIVASMWASGISYMIKNKKNGRKESENG
jgi:hypothetical protein